MTTDNTVPPFVSVVIVMAKDAKVAHSRVVPCKDEAVERNVLADAATKGWRAYVYTLESAHSLAEKRYWTGIAEALVVYQNALLRDSTQAEREAGHALPESVRHRTATVDDKLDTLTARLESFGGHVAPSETERAAMIQEAFAALGVAFASSAIGDHKRAAAQFKAAALQWSNLRGHHSAASTYMVVAQEEQFLAERRS